MILKNLPIFLAVLISSLLGCTKEKLHTSSYVFETSLTEELSPFKAVAYDNGRFLIAGQGLQNQIFMLDDMGEKKGIQGLTTSEGEPFLTDMIVDSKNNTTFVCGSVENSLYVGTSTNFGGFVRLTLDLEPSPLPGYSFPNSGYAYAMVLNPDKTFIITGSNPFFFAKYDYTGKLIWRENISGIINNNQGLYENPINKSELISFFRSPDDLGEINVIYINRNTGKEIKRIELNFRIGFIFHAQSFIIAENGDFITSVQQEFSTPVKNISSTQVYRWDVVNNKIKWKKDFDDDYAMSSVKQTKDNGFIVWGSKFNRTKGVIIKLNSEGTIEWEKTYNQAKAIRDVLEVESGFYLVGVNTSNLIYIAKTGQWGSL